MGAVYAGTADITALGRTLTAAETEAAEILLEAASSKLRLLAAKYGKNIDDLTADAVLGEDYAIAVKNVVVQAVIRALDSISGSSQAVSQTSQTALGYSASVTYLNAGQSLYFLRNELKELGLRRQTFGGLDLYATD